MYFNSKFSILRKKVMAQAFTLGSHGWSPSILKLKLIPKLKTCKNRNNAAKDNSERCKFLLIYTIRYCRIQM